MSAPNIVTTGHDSEGLSTFIDNPKNKAFSPHIGVLYGTVGNGPINLNDNADISAFEAHDSYGLIPKEGSVVLVAEWPPGTDSIAKIHRTMSVDVGVMIAGESVSICSIAYIYFKVHPHPNTHAFPALLTTRSQSYVSLTAGIHAC